jgi:hypothetical protein
MDSSSPAFQAGNDTDPAGWFCEVCSTPISTPSGRKPRVMLCDEHKGKGSSGKAPAKKGTNHDKIATGMTAIYGLTGGALVTVGIVTRDPVWGLDGQAFNMSAPAIGEAWAKMADQSPATQKAILKFLETVGFLSLVGAHVPLALALTNNHVRAARGELTTPAPAGTGPTTAEGV